MKQIRAMMIGAHPDDCDFRCGGLALQYAKAGHKVKFLAMCDGSGGHHIMEPAEIAARRKGETQEVAKLAGIEYDVWDVTDCELIASLENRKRLVREIREFNPDIIFCSRPNDYHADHRNASLLVQDASYLLIVPHFCPDVPAMKKTPVILYFYDHFQNPPFEADIAIRTDDVIEDKFRMLACHESQVFEWLPYTKGTLENVPSDPQERLEWLHEPRIPRDGPLDVGMLKKNLIGAQSEYREAVSAVKYRDKLVERYGEEKGMGTYFAEAFAVCEYGTPLTPDNANVLFPF
jgi:LmbE family N-acetylglucosaminyl deacetylase